MRLFRLLLLLFVCSLTSQAHGATHKWEKPNVLYSRSECMILQEVVFNDTATILHFMTNMMPVDDNYIVNQCCLVDYNGKRHRILSADGIEVGYSQTTIPPVGSRKISLCFEPLPDHEHPFDLIETPTWLGRYMLGISNASIVDSESMDQKHNVHQDKVWDKDTVTIIGKMDVKAMQNGKEYRVSCSFKLLDGSEYAIPDVRVENDGAFVLRYVADRPSLSKLVFDSRRIPYFAYPGDTLMMHVDDFEGVNHRVTWTSKKGYDVHSNLLSACVYMFPDYYTEYVGRYKYQTQQECFREIDSLANVWTRVNDYLAMKYHLTAFEHDVLKQRMLAYFGAVRAKFIYLQESLYRAKTITLSRSEISEEMLMDYDAIRSVEMSGASRYCSDILGIREILDIVNNLNAFMSIPAFPQNERAKVLSRWLAKFFRVEESQIDKNHPIFLYSEKR